MSTSKQMKYIDSAGKETIVDIAVNAANVENNTFTQAAARTNIASGETLPGIFGKLSKWFADLKAVAWSGKYTDLTDRPVIGAAAAYGVANNCGTTAANYVLDARQGQVLQANINQVNSNLGNYTPLHPIGQIGSVNFIDNVSGRWSACKIGLMVIVTVKINVNDNINSGRLLLKDNPFAAFGPPRFDFTNTFKSMLDHKSTGCLYVNEGDSRLYFLTPKAGTYFGELIYVVK